MKQDADFENLDDSFSHWQRCCDTPYCQNDRSSIDFIPISTDSAAMSWPNQIARRSCRLEWFLICIKCCIMDTFCSGQGSRREGSSISSLGCASRSGGRLCGSSFTASDSFDGRDRSVPRQSASTCIMTTCVSCLRGGTSDNLSRGPAVESLSLGPAIESTSYKRCRLHCSINAMIRR